MSSGIPSQACTPQLNIKNNELMSIIRLIGMTRGVEKRNRSPTRASKARFGKPGRYPSPSGSKMACCDHMCPKTQPASERRLTTDRKRSVRVWNYPPNASNLWVFVIDTLESLPRAPLVDTGMIYRKQCIETQGTAKERMKGEAVAGAVKSDSRTVAVARPFLTLLDYFAPHGSCS